MPTTNSDTWHPQLADIPAALGLLTRLPISVDGEKATKRGAQAAWAFPIVGLILWGIIAGLFWILPALPPTIFAVLWIAGTAFITGAMHQDGLADTFDGLWGGWTRERRLEIMKDSSIGTYGVMALICIVALKTAALAVILANGTWAILGVMAFSRALMVPPMALLPNARETGLSRSVGRPTLPVWITAVIFGAVIAIISSGWIILVPMTAAAGIIAWIAYRKIHGQTGDILGATQQITETVGLITLATLY